MRVTKLLAAAAAVSLVATPVFAQGSASKLSVASGARVGGMSGGASALQDETVDDGEGGGAGTAVVAIAAAVAVGLGIYVAVDGGDNDDDLPTSP